MYKTEAENVKLLYAPLVSLAFCPVDEIAIPLEFGSIRGLCQEP